MRVQLLGQVHVLALVETLHVFVDQVRAARQSENALPRDVCEVGVTSAHTHTHTACGMREGKGGSRTLFFVEVGDTLVHDGGDFGTVRVGHGLFERSPVELGRLALDQRRWAGLGSGSLLLLVLPPPPHVAQQASVSHHGRSMVARRGAV